jgi:uncharacterized protein YbjT (DUF2867 family)
MSRTAALIGATGLIGGHILELLMKDNDYSKIKTIGRRPLEVPVNTKVEQIIVDFEDQKALGHAIAGSDVVFSAIGTTNKQVKGDKNAYRKVDYDIPVNAAKAAAKYGVYSFAMVSAIGANAANNNNFYIKLKGVVEEAVSKEQIPQIIITRPSLLMGKRKEYRFTEKAFQAVMPAFAALFFGGWRKYKPIEGEDVAKAMINAVAGGKKGIFIYDYDDMKKLAQ